MTTQLGDLKFGNAYFRGQIFDRNEIESSIWENISFLRKNILSDSPFILLKAYNHIKTVISFFAITRLGKICVLIDPLVKRFEINGIIEQIHPCAFQDINQETIEFNYQKEIKIYSGSSFHHEDIDDVCLIIYTNAEDGNAKGAMITHKNFLAEINTCLSYDTFDKTRTVSSLLPYSHLFGFVNGLLVPTHSEASFIISELTSLRSIEVLIKDIIDYKATNFFTVPALYYLLSRSSEIKRISENMKSIISGGSKLTQKILDTFYEKTGHFIHEGYGLTEASPVCTWHPQGSKIKIESVGVPFPCCEVKIFNNDNIECKVGEVGEICVKGDNVFKGYYKNPDATNFIKRNGWLHSGDYGKTDEQGYIYYMGLKKNMINIGGYNVYPKEVEKFVYYNHNVDFVKIYGELTEYKGHVVRGEVRLKNRTPQSELGFKAWCIENIAEFKLPKIWNFI